MTDVDQLLRDHAAGAAAVEPSPDAWDRLVDRLADGPALVVPVDRRRGDGRRSPRLWAAAVVVVAGLAVVLVVAGDDGAEVRTGPPSTSVLTPSTSTTVPPPTGPVDIGPRPDRAVVLVDPDGDGLAAVARLDGLGPAAVEDGPAGLVTLVPDRPVPAGEPVAAASGALRVDVGPDGTAYYERCCEPAVGEVWAVDAATGEDRGRVTFGEAPAVSPDGSTLAVSVQGVGVQLVDLASRTATTTIEEGADAPGLVTDLAWSPDGRTPGPGVVVLGTDGTDPVVAATLVEVLDLDAADPTWEPLADAGSGLAFPTFLADGRIVVGTGTARGVPDVAASGLAIIDPATGERGATWYGRLDVRAIDATPDGRWVVATSDGGALRAYTGDELRDTGTVAVLPDGVVDTTW